MSRLKKLKKSSQDKIPASKRVLDSVAKLPSDKRAQIDQIYNGLSIVNHDYVNYVYDNMSLGEARPEGDELLYETEMERFQAEYVQRCFNYAADNFMRGDAGSTVTGLTYSIAMYSCCPAFKEKVQDVFTGRNKENGWSTDVLRQKCIDEAMGSPLDSPERAYYNKMVESGKLGYIPMTESTVALTRIGMAKRAYDDMRQPGADIERIQSNYAFASGILDRRVEADGLDAGMVDYMQKCYMTQMFNEDRRSERMFTAEGAGVLTADNIDGRDCSHLSPREPYSSPEDVFLDIEAQRSEELAEWARSGRMPDMANLNARYGMMAQDYLMDDLHMSYGESADMVMDQTGIDVDSDAARMIQDAYDAAYEGYEREDFDPNEGIIDAEFTVIGPPNGGAPRVRSLFVRQSRIPTDQRENAEEAGTDPYAGFEDEPGEGPDDDLDGGHSGPETGPADRPDGGGAEADDAPDDTVRPTGRFGRLFARFLPRGGAQDAYYEPIDERDVDASDVPGADPLLEIDGMSADEIVEWAMRDDHPATGGEVEHMTGAAAEPERETEPEDGSKREYDVEPERSETDASDADGGYGAAMEPEHEAESERQATDDLTDMPYGTASRSFRFAPADDDLEESYPEQESGLVQESAGMREIDIEELSESLDRVMPSAPEPAPAPSSMDKLGEMPAGDTGRKLTIEEIERMLAGDPDVIAAENARREAKAAPDKPDESEADGPFRFAPADESVSYQYTEPRMSATLDKIDPDVPIVTDTSYDHTPREAGAWRDHLSGADVSEDAAARIAQAIEKFGGQAGQVQAQQSEGLDKAPENDVLAKMRADLRARTASLEAELAGRSGYKLASVPKAEAAEKPADISESRSAFQHWKEKMFGPKAGRVQDVDAVYHDVDPEPVQETHDELSMEDDIAPDVPKRPLFGFGRKKQFGRQEMTDLGHEDDAIEPIGRETGVRETEQSVEPAVPIVPVERPPVRTREDDYDSRMRALEDHLGNLMENMSAEERGGHDGPDITD